MGFKARLQVKSLEKTTRLLLNSVLKRYIDRYFVSQDPC